MVNKVKVPLFINEHPGCNEKQRLTTWRGEPGLDPDMREYTCPKCDYTTYVVRRGSRKANLDELVGNMEDVILQQKENAARYGAVRSRGRRR